ncbi:beta-ketoacyl-ACP synthase II [Candidatus Woesearchaeota archaeon]|nr:beta-ketoacyl-ACP synthase II [Candidatus Woesearchaeota archaeon]
MEGNRVVITGMGCVTPIGIGIDQYKTALEMGVSGAGPLTNVEDTEGLNVLIACEVDGFDPNDYMSFKTAKRTDLSTQFSLAAMKEAITDAGLSLTEDGNLALDDNNQRVSIIMGTGIGGFKTTQEQTRILLNKGPRRVNPLAIPKLMPNAVAALGSLEFLIHGNAKTVNSACSSANDAIADAYDKLVLGRADVTISGGSDAGISKLTIAAFANMGALTKQYNDNPTIASRPFDMDRSGFVIGEGSGVVVMERLEYAQARGARIYAEVLGYGATSDAFHLTAPSKDGSGAISAMQMALDMAGLRPEQVDYINAHGTSTPLNDKMETIAIRKVFGAYADNLFVSSTKSMVGHLLGAAGGAELIATVLGMQHDTVYPTINYTTPDPECDLNYVPNKALNQVTNVALSNSFGFGGHNVCLAVKKYEG